MKKDIRKEIISHLMSIAFIIVFLIVGTVYVYYPTKSNLLSSVTFLQKQENFYIQDVSSGIKLAEAFPISDSEGLQSTPYQFKIVNNTNHEIKFQLLFRNQLDKVNERGLEALDAKYLRYSLQQFDKETIVNELDESEIIYTGTIASNSELTYNFSLWLGEDNFDEDAMGKTFIGQMEIKEIKGSI